MNILFVCSGNTCRSPMAEGYLNSKNIKGLLALSAGFISEGEAVSENSVKVLKEIGIDISEHKSRLITKDLLSADKIFCMSRTHYDMLIAAGVKKEKVFVLRSGIPDPFGQSIEVYRLCRDEIINAIDNALYSGQMLPIKVFAATKEDIKYIADLEKQCFSLPWSENGILESMEHKTVFFVSLHKDLFAGYIGVTAVADEGYINNIAVAKGHRNSGVGSLLLDRAITFSREQNLKFLSLEVRASNNAAISLYKKAGFVSEGIRKGFYENPKEDGIIMTRRFSV